MDIKFDSRFVRVASVGKGRGQRTVASSYADEKAKALIENIPVAVRDVTVEAALLKGARKTAASIRKEARAKFDTRRGRGEWTTYANRHKKTRRQPFGYTYSSIRAKRGKPEFFPSAFAKVSGAFNLLEYGHFIKRDGRVIGYSKKRPFFHPGVEKAKNAQDEAVEKELRALLPDAIKEAWKRTEEGRRAKYNAYAASRR